MIAIDTNILVRLLANDDPQQSGKAAELFATEDVFIPKTVMLETEWVLRFTYELPRKAIGAAFAGLLSTASVTLEDSAKVRAAVDAYSTGMDFADALHLLSSVEATRFLTFDRKLGRKAAGAKTALRVQVI